MYFNGTNLPLHRPPDFERLKSMTKMREKVARASGGITDPALREYEARYQALLEASTDAIFLETLSGQVLDCNSGAAAAGHHHRGGDHRRPVR